MASDERPLLHAPEFFGAAPLAAMLLLALNDAFLKHTFHNGLTGKLSDFAGCFALPLFISAVLAPFGAPAKWRASLGAAATAVLFAGVKLSAGAGELLCRWLSPVARALGVHGALRIVADPTDLVALAMIPLALLYAQRAHEGDGRLVTRAS